MENELKPSEMEMLNRFLDRDLSDADVLSFADQLSQNEALKAELKEMMAVRQALKSLPVKQPSRKYILTRQMAREAKPLSWVERLFPAFRAGMAFAVVGLMLTFLFPFLSISHLSPMVVPLETDIAANSVALIQGFDETDGMINQTTQPVTVSSEPSIRSGMSQGNMGGNPKQQYLMAVNRQIPDNRNQFEKAEPNTQVESGMAKSAMEVTSNENSKVQNEVQALIHDKQPDSVPEIRFTPMQTIQGLLIFLLVISFLGILVLTSLGPRKRI